jgi:hypothetical protein
MENLFFKFGIVLVGIAVIMLLVGFAYSALSNTIKLPDDNTKLSGNIVQLVSQIEKICTTCLRAGNDMDCKIMELDTSQPLAIGDFKNNIKLMQDLPAGKHTIKIYTEKNICLVRKL